MCITGYEITMMDLFSGSHSYWTNTVEVRHLYCVLHVFLQIYTLLAETTMVPRVPPEPPSSPL